MAISVVFINPLNPAFHHVPEQESYMLEWQNDEDLFALCRRELFTAVVGDICDQVGLRRQFFGPKMRPLHQGGGVPILVGRAMPVLEVDIFAEPTGPAPYGKMLEALDSLQHDEIYVCAGGTARYALVGELMCTAMQLRGAGRRRLRRLRS